MIASVPLIMAGYPMINVGLDQEAKYENGIKRVSYWAVDVCALFMVIFHPGTQRRPWSDDDMPR